MKTMTITAVMALLVAIPLILKTKKTLTLLKIDRSGNESVTLEENERYAIDDFLT